MGSEHVEDQRNLFGELQTMPPPRRRTKVPKVDYSAPLIPGKKGEMGKLEKAFWSFHQDNPQIYRLLVKFARQWRQAKGPDSLLGISNLFERVRWEKSIQTTDEAFKLNNNHRAFYARLIMDYCPDLEGIFRVRRQRIQATVGPDNTTLPPGEHIS